MHVETMCTAQVLLLADAMRRNDYSTGRPNILPPRRICRKLFVEEAPEQIRTSRSNLLKTLEAQMLKEFTNQYNFNIQTETPLPGRYQWVPMRPSANCTKAWKGSRAEASVVSEIQSRTDSTKTRQSSKTSSTASPKSKMVTQSKITDFLLHRKRHRTTELDLTSPKLKSRRLNVQLDAQATSN